MKKKQPNYRKIRALELELFPDEEPTVSAIQANACLSDAPGAIFEVSRSPTTLLHADAMLREIWGLTT